MASEGRETKRLRTVLSEEVEEGDETQGTRGTHQQRRSKQEGILNNRAGGQSAEESKIVLSIKEFRDSHYLQKKIKDKQQRKEK